MADTKVRNNSPDPKRYHVNAPGQPPGTMLPLARNATDGRSFGFDHNMPQEVIVDPGEEGGGFRIDMLALASMKDSFNAAASSGETAADPSMFLKQISKTMSKKAASTPKPKAVAKKSTQGKAMLRQAPPPPALSSLVFNDEPELSDELTSDLDAMIEETEEELEDTQSVVEDETADLEAELLLLRSQLAAVERKKKAAATPNMTAQIAAIVRAVLQEPKVAPVPEPQEPATPAVVNLFESLSIPFLKGDKAERPKFETYFELGKFGTMAARYHAVVEGKGCLVLVYDTRFEDGFQYLPPSLGEEPISISVPQLNKSWECSSFGLHYTLGCLDVVILLTTSEEKQ